MANLRSSKKDIRRIAKRNVANSIQRSKVRTLLKKAQSAVNTANTYKDGYDMVVLFEKNAMIATKNHTFSKQSVARRTSALVKVLKSRFKQEEQVL